MIFVLGLDRGFVMPSGVAIRSLDRFLTERDRIVVLHLALGEDDIASLSACAAHATVDFIECSGRIHDAWVPPAHVSEAAFLRYLAPELLPSEGRCVYLDGDVIVRKDPTPLHDADLGGASVGAVRSRVTPFVASPGGVVGWFELGIPSTSPYFNSGVLAMDLDRWRQRDVTARVTTYLEQFGQASHLADQEALNAAVAGDWMQLDRSWNYVTHVTESFLQQPELEPVDPAIVHFAGRSKPWAHGRLPIFAEEWYEVLRSTPWSGYRPSAPMRPSGPRASVRSAAAGLLRRVRSLAAEPER